MEIFFGTDGWRAFLDSQINEQSVSVVAQAFADYALAQTTQASVAIAYDTRRNSRLFAELFAEVLSGNKIRVLLADQVTPTPVLSFTVKDKQCFAGVMITASHNPPEYNGIKFKSALGGPFSSENTKEVEKLLFRNTVKKSNELISKLDFFPPYIQHIEQLINFSAISRLSFPVLIDSMGGAGTLWLEKILRKNNCKAETIYGEASDTFHNRLAEPIEKNLHPLMQQLQKGKYAFGVATDGDADRVGACLDNGCWLSAQETILLIVDYLKHVRKQAGGLVKTSSVTDKIRSLFESADTPVYDVQVGFKYITDIMVREPIVFGGEESGGFGYGIHIPERDGIFSALVLLEMLAVSGFSTLSEYLRERQKYLGIIHYDRIDAHYDLPDKNNLLPWLQKDKITQLSHFKIVETKSFLSSRDIVNGLKFIFQGDCRWLLIRCSETENMIRYYAEGQTDEEVKTLLAEGPALLRKISDDHKN